MNEQISALARIAAQEEHDQAVFQALRGWHGRGHEGNYHAADKGFETCPHPQCVLVRQSLESAAPRLPERAATTPEILGALKGALKLPRPWIDGGVTFPEWAAAFDRIQAVIAVLEAERPAPAAEPKQIEHESRSPDGDGHEKGTVVGRETSAPAKPTVGTNEGTGLKGRSGKPGAAEPLLPATSSMSLTVEALGPAGGSTPPDSLSPSVAEPSAVTETPKQPKCCCTLSLGVAGGDIEGCPVHGYQPPRLAAPPAVGAPIMETPPTCAWVPCEDFPKLRIYDTACGHEYDNTDPANEDMTFCGFCGKSMVWPEVGQFFSREVMPSDSTTGVSATDGGGASVAQHADGAGGASLLQIEQLPAHLRRSAKYKDSEGFKAALIRSAELIEKYLPEVQGVLASLRAEIGDWAVRNARQVVIIKDFSERSAKAETERDALQADIDAFHKNTHDEEGAAETWHLVYRETLAERDALQKEKDSDAWHAGWKVAVQQRDAALQELTDLKKQNQRWMEQALLEQARDLLEVENARDAARDALIVLQKVARNVITDIHSGACLYCGMRLPAHYEWCSLGKLAALLPAAEGAHPK